MESSGGGLGLSFRNVLRVPFACSLLIASGLVACSTSSDAPGGAGTAGTGGDGSGGASAGSTGGDGISGGQTNEAGASGAVEPGAFCSRGKPVLGATVPAGFCVRLFATVPEARTMVFAPNGDLFVASPSTSTPGGAAGGVGQILLITDDNHDGTGEVHVFAKNLADVHGIAVGDGYLYFTAGTTVFRTPYSAGQREEAGPREDMGMPMAFGHGRWTHGLARSVGGALLASSGEYSSCNVDPSGGILQVTKGGAASVAVGFRNPMYLRCHYKDEICAANELGEDQETGAREKFLVIKPDTNYGYPCCFGSKQPRSSGTDAMCAPIAPEEASYTLSNTPFGLDWEHDQWPAPYTGGVFVALHGSAYSSPAWAGTKIVFAPADPTTHLPQKDAWQEFVGGFGPGGGALDRPADLSFAPDGRMFFTDDMTGHVYWVAPETLLSP